MGSITRGELLTIASIGRRTWNRAGRGKGVKEKRVGSDSTGDNKGGKGQHRRQQGREGTAQETTREGRDSTGDNKGGKGQHRRQQGREGTAQETTREGRDSTAAATLQVSTRFTMSHTIRLLHRPTENPQYPAMAPWAAFCAKSKQYRESLLLAGTERMM
jgi:hypothetical protein